MYKAIIIDDVADARLTLKQDLADYCSDVQVIAEADGVVSGAKILKKEKPDVVFLDIQMQDGTGFDLLDILGDFDFKVIFTTASDAHAIQAFKLSAIDYLLKPIDPDELIKAVEKLQQFQKNDPASFDLLNDSLQQKQPKRLALNTLDKIHVAEISEIVRCESNVNYTKIYFEDGKNLLVTKTLKEFDELLTPYQFARVHQSHLVNLNFIKSFNKTDGGYLVMKDGSTVSVSSRKRQHIVELISDF